MADSPGQQLGAMAARAKTGRSMSLRGTVGNVSGWLRRSSQADDITVEIARMKKMIKQQQSCIINPRTAKWIQYWDAFSFICLLFTATVTPVEVTLLQSIALADLPDNPRHLTLFTMNRVVDLFFSIDMIFNFFLAYQEPTYRGGRWVTQRHKIVANYLRTWFFIDLVSVLPIDILTRLSSDDAISDLQVLRTVRFVRLIRLVKLLRILRASRIIARWQNFIGLSFAQLTMIKFITVTFFLIHFMACGWSYTGLNWSPTPGSTLEWETTWLEHYGFATVDEVAAGKQGGSLNRNVAPHRLYFISLYVAVCAMFGSVGSISPRNYAEYTVITMMMLIGSMVWAWVIGSLCGILATLNPHSTAFQNLMDELNYFMRVQQFDGDHRVRLREFFRQTQDYARTQTYDKLLLKMSAQLRGDTALMIGTATLEKIWYFWQRECEPEFLSLVALNLQAVLYEAREMMPTFDLTVIDRGVVARRLVILTKGAVLGTDTVIPDQFRRFRPLEAAYSLTYTQASVISRMALFRIVEHFPAASRSLHHAAAIYTLKGAFRLAWTEHKRALRAQGKLGARVSSQEVHSGALQYSKGSAVIAAFTGAGVLLPPPAPADDAFVSIAEKKRQEKLNKYRHFRQQSGATCAEKLAGSAPAVMARAATSGGGGAAAAPRPPFADEEIAEEADEEDDPFFGDPIVLHRELRALRAAEKHRATHVTQQVEALRHDVKVSMSGVHAKLEGVVGAISMLEKGIRAIAHGHPHTLAPPPEATHTHHAHSKHSPTHGHHHHHHHHRHQHHENGAAPPPRTGSCPTSPTTPVDSVWDDPAPRAEATRSRAQTMVSVKTAGSPSSAAAQAAGRALTESPPAAHAPASNAGRRRHRRKEASNEDGAPTAPPAPPANEPRDSDPYLNPFDA